MEQDLEDGELRKLKDELSSVCAQFELFGGKISDKQYERLIELQKKGTDIELRNAIDHFKREIAKLKNKK